MTCETVNILWDKIDSSKVNIDFKGSEHMYKLRDSMQNEWQCVSNVLKRIPILIDDQTNLILQCSSVRLKVWKRIVNSVKNTFHQKAVYQMTTTEKEGLIADSTNDDHNSRKKSFFQILEIQHQQQQNQQFSNIEMQQVQRSIQKKEKYSSSMLQKGKKKYCSLRVLREKKKF